MSTVTAPPPPSGPAGAPGPRHAAPPPGQREAPSAPATGRVQSAEAPAVGRTLVGLLASALAVLPLKALFDDSGWILDAWLAMAVVVVPAALLRWRRPAGALDIWPGVILLVPWLTARYVSAHAWLGVIPTTGTWHDVSHLMGALHRTTRDQVAPVHTTVAIRLVLCALVGLLAALIDLVAVVGRRGALAGAPILVVFTICGAVPRKPVSWVWFTFAAIGFLLLLALGTVDETRTWGRVIRGRRVRTGRQRAVPLTAQRISVIALAAAVVLPLLAPGDSRNLLADAFHRHHVGLADFGAGGGGSISPFVSIRSQLQPGTPVQLMTVHVSGDSQAVPFYLRVNVLSDFTGVSWKVADHGATESVLSTGFGVEPVAPREGNVATMSARLSISGLDSNVPLFAVPDALGGVPAGTTWSPQDELLLGPRVHSGQQITEHFEQPEPTVDQLRAAPEPQVPLPSDLVDAPGVAPYVHKLVARLTASAHGPYERAAAIQRYFTDPANGFKYDLNTSVGKTGDPLVDFLKGKHGFCQQYATAMGAMLRLAGVPSRVVLGYEHPAPDSSGNFTVTSHDAHSWVEAYFQNIGWIPFDPTPPGGLAGGAATDLPWAPHSYGIQQNNTDINKPNATGSGTPTVGDPNSVSGSAHPAGAGPLGAGAGSSGGGLSAAGVVVLVLVLVLLVLLLIPASIRIARRRRRYAAARREGDTEALWAELSDTAVDLGYVWSPARSPRQVAQWLARDARSSRDALQALAVAVEHRRYAPAVGAATDGVRTDSRLLRHQLREVTEELRSRRSGRARLSALLLPASLTASLRWWPGRGGGRRRR